MIPYSVDASLDHRPVVNWVVFAGLALAFIIKVKVPHELIEPFVLHGWSVPGLLLYSWLHTNPVHLVFNLLFLWPFGNALCGKIGNKAYIAVFLGFNLLGGILQAIFSDNPAVAPCAAICAVVGMYVVFFPENTIGCFFLVPRPVLLDVSGSFIVFVWFLVDLVTTLWGVQAVAYFIHIFSFAAGLGLAVLMLKKKWIVMAKDEKSLLQMLRPDKQQPEQQQEEAQQQKEADRQGGDLETAEKPMQRPAKQEQKSYQSKTKTAKPEGIISFMCLCGRKIKVPCEYAGRTGRCPACGKLIKIPEKQAPSQES